MDQETASRHQRRVNCTLSMLFCSSYKKRAICFSVLLELSNTKSGLTSQGKRLLFSKVAFGLHGNWFAAGDHLGNLYHFDLAKNR